VSITKIRHAERGDMAAVAEWNAAMAWETEQKRLDLEVLTRGVAAVFDEPRRGFYLIAEREGQAVGCLLVTYEWSDWRNGDFWWIQSVYVVPEARRGGVFRSLYTDVAQRAKEAGAVGLRLYVETENHRAQGTYRELGMEQCHYFMYEQMLS
jgi:GNAT superfamily N-acetyltransferase